MPRKPTVVPDPKPMTLSEFILSQTVPEPVRDIVRAAVEIVEAKERNSFDDTKGHLDELETGVHELRKANLDGDWR